MSRIAILTDSSAYLRPDIVHQYNLQVMPLKVHWREETFLDGVEITPEEFYVRLANETVLPTTSQPSMHEFLQVFEELAPDCDGIIVPLISSGISGTVASALAASAEFSKVPIEIIDTHVTTAGLAMIVLAIARAIEKGASLDEVAKLARSIADKMHTYFVVDTLEYLHKGGRIGGASRYLGTALSIKPILTFDDEGKIDALERVRTRRKALARLIELAKGTSDGHPVRAGVIHANAQEDAVKFRDELIENLHLKEIDIFELSPVIGTHVGPGTIGLSLYRD